MDSDQIINESNAYTSRMAGEYLEEIKVKSFEEMTAEQWLTFIDVVTLNYDIKKAELSG